MLLFGKGPVRIIFAPPTGHGSNSNLLTHRCAARKGGGVDTQLHGGMMTLLTAVPLWGGPGPSGEKKKAGGWPKKIYRLKEDQAFSLSFFLWNWVAEKKLCGIRVQISSFTP
jgi:hypothetical protein